MAHRRFIVALDVSFDVPHISTIAVTRRGLSQPIERPFCIRGTTAGAGHNWKRRDEDGEPHAVRHDLPFRLVPRSALPHHPPPLSPALHLLQASAVSSRRSRRRRHLRRARAALPLPPRVSRLRFRFRLPLQPDARKRSFHSKAPFPVYSWRRFPQGLRSAASCWRERVAAVATARRTLPLGTVNQPFADQSFQPLAHLFVPPALAPQRSSQCSRGRLGVGIELEQIQQHAVVNRCHTSLSTRRLGLLDILHHFVADPTFPADVDRVHGPASGRPEAADRRLFAATEGYDHVGYRAEGRRIAVLMWLVRPRYSHTGFLGMLGWVPYIGRYIADAAAARGRWRSPAALHEGSVEPVSTGLYRVSGDLGLAFPWERYTNFSGSRYSYTGFPGSWPRLSASAV